MNVNIPKRIKKSIENNREWMRKVRSGEIDKSNHNLKIVKIDEVHKR